MAGERAWFWARTVGGCVTAIGLGLALWWSRVDAQTTAPVLRLERAVPEVVVVEATEVAAAQVYHGVIRPRQRALLAFTEGGRLDARPARIGDAVRAGAVLARLDAEGFAHAIEAANANAEELSVRSAQLARDEARSQRLHADGVTTDAVHEQAVSGLARANAMHAAARASLAESRRRRRETVLRAPFDGIVTDVMVEPGELVRAGQPILRLSGDGGHEVVLQVQAELARTLEEGSALELVATGLDATDPLAHRTLTGTVRAVVAQASGLEGFYPVVIDVEPDVALRAGLGVEVVLHGAPRTGLRVPLGAVLDPSGRRPFVWKVVEGRAERAWLRIGRLDEGSVEVREGLAPGERIVVRGHTRLLPGDPVGGDR